MSKLQELYDKRGKVLHEMKDMVAQAEKEDRGLNAEEEVKWQKADEDIKDLTARIEKGEEIRKLLSGHESAMQDVSADVAEVRSGFTTSTSVPAQEEKRTVTYSDAFAEWASTGTVSSAEARSVLQQGLVKGREFRGTDAQVSSDTTLGGYLSPEEWANEVVESMKAYGGMLQAGTIRTTKGGDTLHIPTEDVTAQLGAIIGQGVADGVADIDWGEKTMGAFTYTSKIIKVSQELYAEDDAYNVLGRVGDIAASRVGRKINLDFTVGAGTTEPFGITVSASNSGISAGSATAISRAELLDLMHSVDPAYRVGPKVGYMFNDTVLANIRKLSIGSADDRPLWQPSMREGAPDTVEGKQYYINQDMPAPTTGNKSVLFGDFSKYSIRQVRGMTLSRSDQRFWDERVVAYFLTGRWDGLLLDTAAVKYFEQA